VTVLDTYTYGSSADDISYGRETDGGSTWTTFSSPSPGASNNGASLPLGFEFVTTISVSKKSLV